MRKTNIKKNILLKTATVTKNSASFFGGNLCSWWHYQPKKPESVKKMRKF